MGRYDINEVADAVIGVRHSLTAAEGNVGELFAAHGLDAEDVLEVVSHTGVDDVTKHQAMAMGVAIGVHLAESVPAAG